MAVNRMSFEGASLESLGAVMGSAGPIGNIVNAAQPEAAPQVAAPSPNSPTIARGMA